MLIIGWAILAALVCIFLQLARHPRLNRIRDTFKDKSATLFTDLLGSSSSTRRTPLSTIELEENLKVNLPVPFATFGQEDWRRFWRLLYGKYEADSGSWPRRKRQLTKEEIQDILISDYYRPFGSFKQRQWGIFWQHILKGKVF